MDDHPRVERQQAIGRGEQGLMSISLIHRCSTTRSAEADQELLERGEVDRPAAAHALERREDLGLLHHPPGQRRIERRQAQRAVLEDLDELAAGAEEEHRAELRVEAAADDQLVAVELDHRLDGHAVEMPGAGAVARPPTRSRDRRGGPPRRRSG